MKSRRQFLQMLSSAVLAPLVVGEMKAGQAKAAETKPSQIPLAFSTLGCPAWEWKKILDFAQQHGFSAIELRGLEGKLDLPAHPIFAADRIEQTKQEIRASKLKIACVSSSAQMYMEDPAKRAAQLADARRFIDLAAALESPYMRVFGGKAGSDKNPAPDDDTKARVAAGLRELGAYAGPHHVTVIIESHDHFTASATLKDVLSRADSEHVGLLWDAHHTFATSNEDPEFTVKQLGPWIRHTHLKDSVGSGEDRKYVLTGRGNVPIQRQIEALRSIGYKGFYCFEWEKVWHPDIADPEIAIADYARVVGQCLGNARACGLL
ncbi:MAG TPA: sugar phosphate isomerase/epimerase family protein [Candidatus Sulfotelmatobacter sp.]|nr:sugar phosphate isomerase/epimerase family protein [Candidatus Sulfotelmatobacter sp.]